MVVALLTGVIYGAMLQPGHNWGDDFSQYLAHAVNLATGQPYKEIKHLQHPLLPIAPETYPVVYPLLLAPVYAVFGLDLVAFKVVGTICFIGFLLLLWPVFRPYLSGMAIFCLTLLLAANPAFFAFKEHILSEFPFLFFLFLSFWVMQRARGTRTAGRQLFLYGLVGLCIFLVAGCRSIGLALLPAWICEVLFSKSRQQYKVLGLGLSLLVFGALYGGQAWYLHDGGNGYGSQFQRLFRPAVFLDNLQPYRDEGALFWGRELMHKLRLILLATLILLSLAGFTKRLIKNGPGVLEVFTLAFLSLTLAWPWFQGFRFLIPVIPLAFFYAFYFADRSLVGFRQAKGWVFTLLVLFWGAPYLLTYGKAGQKTEPDLLRPDTLEMLAFVRQLPAPARVAFPKPRVIALYTNQYSMVSFCMGTAETLDRFLTSNQINYFIVAEKDFPGVTACYAEYAAKYPEKVKLRFANAGFMVYQRLP